MGQGGLILVAVTPPNEFEATEATLHTSSTLLAPVAIEIHPESSQPDPASRGEIENGPHLFQDWKATPKQGKLSLECHYVPSGGFQIISQNPSLQTPGRGE